MDRLLLRLNIGLRLGRKRARPCSSRGSFANGARCRSKAGRSEICRGNVLNDTDCYRREELCPLGVGVNKSLEAEGYLDDG